MVQLWRRSGLFLRAADRDSGEAIEAQMETDPDFFLGAFEDSSLVATIIVSSDGRKGWLNRLGVSTAQFQPDKECSGCLNCVVICPDVAIEIRSS